MSSALERFLRYVTIDTQSNDKSDVTPSTPCQFDLARLLVEELKQLGLTDAAVDEHCYVMATLPGNLPEGRDDAPVIGLIAHLDTSDSCSGKNVRPRVMEYHGGDVVLESGLKIPEDADLLRNQGRSIVVTDGTTLLGGDDKAGIASIMAAVETLLKKTTPRGRVRICFTPDEEIGNGTAFFDLKKFGAQYAYTVDSGGLGEINCETFTADKAVMTINGKDIHPGYAKDRMVNAGRVLSRVIAALPLSRTPEQTQGREPFIHLLEVDGDVTLAKAEFILRAFEESDRRKNQQILQDAFHAQLNATPDASGTLEIKTQYLNMKRFLDDHPRVTQRLEQAVRECGAEPRWIPVRGGTDGSRLSEMGLPTPNIFAGYYRCHSLTEWLAVDELEKSVDVLVRLVELWAREEK
ncbi:MAG: peptidase T [Thermoguttaceae bacterium]|nr:peptidase T [Thermoguttaceae bacterium]